MQDSTENRVAGRLTGTEIRESGDLEREIPVFQENAASVHSVCRRLEDVIGRLTGPEPVEHFGEPEADKSAGILEKLREHGEHGRQALDRLERLVNRLDELI